MTIICGWSVVQKCIFSSRRHNNVKSPLNKSTSVAMCLFSRSFLALSLISTSFHTYTSTPQSSMLHSFDTFYPRNDYSSERPFDRALPQLNSRNSLTTFNSLVRSDNDQKNPSFLYKYHSQQWTPNKERRHRHTLDRVIHDRWRSK